MRHKGNSRPPPQRVLLSDRTKYSRYFSQSLSSVTLNSQATGNLLKLHQSIKRTLKKQLNTIVRYLCYRLLAKCFNAVFPSPLWSSKMPDNWLSAEVLKKSVMCDPVACSSLWHRIIKKRFKGCVSVSVKRRLRTADCRLQTADQG